MKCARVLDIVDSRGLGELRARRRARLERHALECETCGPDLKTAQALEDRLRDLPEPAPPAGMAAAVLARIEAAEAAPESPAHPADRLAWVVLAAGIALAMGAHAYRLWTGDAAPPLPSSLLWTWVDDLATIPQPDAGFLAFVAGVALSVAGLARLFADAPSPEPSPSAEPGVPGALRGAQ